MNIEQKILRALHHYEKNRPLFAEVPPAVIKNFEEKLSKFLEYMEPLDGMDMSAYRHLEEVFQNLTVKPKNIQQSLDRLGMTYPTKAGRKKFIIEATRRGIAPEIAAELLKKPANPLDDKLRSLVHSPGRVESLTDTELKALLKFAGRQPLSKTAVQKKKFDREGSLLALRSYLAERASRTGM